VPVEPPDVRLTQEFGASVSTVWNSNSLLVGAPGTDGHGAVYEFRLTNGVWKQAAKILAPDMAPGRFGSQVVRANDDVLISDRERHRVYAFRLQNGTWRPRAILRGGAEGFGRDIRIQGCAAVISSTNDIDTGPPPTQPGYVHIYNRCVTNDGAWTYVQSLLVPGSKPGDHFGTSVAFSNSTLMVGAPGENVPAWEPSTGFFDWAAEVIPAGDRLAASGFGARIALTSYRAFISGPGDAGHSLRQQQSFLGAGLSRKVGYSQGHNRV
jgi:hypothetical protein